MSASLVRPRDRVIAGVCAGLARRFNMSSTTMRVLWLIGALLPGPAWIAYVVLWLVMPNEQPFDQG